MRLSATIGLRWIFAISVVLAAGGLGYAGLPVSGPGIALRPGEWDVRPRDGGSIRRVCIKDRTGLIQLRHPGRSCDWIVLNQTRTEMTVQYTCKGSGFGRTQLRRETAQLVQIETQGVADGLPFDFSAEGRWAGECGRLAE